MSGALFFLTGPILTSIELPSDQLYRHFTPCIVRDTSMEIPREEETNFPKKIHGGRKRKKKEKKKQSRLVYEDNENPLESYQRSGENFRKNGNWISGEGR